MNATGATFFGARTAEGVRAQEKVLEETFRRERDPRQSRVVRKRGDLMLGGRIKLLELRIPIRRS